MIEVTAEIVRDLLDYNPETGEFTWKARDRKYCKSDHSWKSWNTKCSGLLAGSDHKSTGYREIGIFNKLYKAHRLAWLHYYGEWPDEIDHINHIKDDNRIENLRNVTHSQNGKNKSIQSGGTSQYKGVGWFERDSKWMAYIRINGKQKYLGLFTIEEDAARAYDRAALEHFGIYASLNFPIEDYLDKINMMHSKNLEDTIRA